MSKNIKIKCKFMVTTYYSPLVAIWQQKELRFHECVSDWENGKLFVSYFFQKYSFWQILGGDSSDKNKMKFQCFEDEMAGSLIHHDKNLNFFQKVKFIISTI